MTNPLTALTALLLAAAVSHLDMPVRWRVALILAMIRAVTLAVRRAHPLIPRPVLRTLQGLVRHLIARSGD